MASVTIVITDTPRGYDCTVVTNAAAPTVGVQRTPAQELGAKLLQICHRQAALTTYGNDCAAMVGEMVRAEAEAGRGHITIHHDGTELSAAQYLASSPLKD